MPFIASSVQGFSLDPSLRSPAGRLSPPASCADDGARPSTAAVCRHLLGDAIDGQIEDFLAGTTPTVRAAGTAGTAGTATPLGRVR